MTNYTLLQKDTTEVFVQGRSFCFPLSHVSFITWRMNDETGSYWLKFHFTSGKEIRITVNLGELNNLLNKWTNSNVNYRGNENELENTR